MSTGDRLEGNLRLKKATEVVVFLNDVVLLWVTIAGVVNDQCGVELAAEEAYSDFA